MRWRHMLAAARLVVAALPAGELGCCVCDARGNLIRLDASALRRALDSNEVRFHAGLLYGAYPAFV